NVYYAQHGYAVLNYSARGWGRSCGSEESRKETAGCEKGWIHLADQRYEARDTQYLLGLLAEQRITNRKRIGVTGISYGGGQSIELAYLHNRIRLPSGAFAPWTTPKGKKMQISAAYPRWPWSDLVSALEPNGRFLDTEVAGPFSSRGPLGVEIQSYTTGLFADAPATGGYVAPAGMDPEADLTKWFGAVNAGEPATAEDEEIAAKIYSYHGGYSIGGTPAPLLIQNGWTDDLFPPKEALRVYNLARSQGGKVTLQFGDLGHSRGANKLNTDHAFQEEGSAFFGAWLEHSGTKPKSGKVTAYTMTCPTSAPGGGPYVAKNWAKLHPHAVAFGSTTAQTFTSAGGNPTIAADFDPIAGTSEACKTVKAEEEPDTANYNLTSKGFTLMGLPTVKATVKVTGQAGGLDGEIVARLWDVMPGGEERLITRGVYRTTETEATPTPITFQLHGNGYDFPAGDTVRLQLLGRDVPYYRASNGTFAVEASNVTVTLPTT
ncbi:MAG TPA: CocE/NonD family hydrolase C-terminal non-catalytic domain-containing protein, partial [Solirubrobacteraceae bacterium]|nr:CocE/NonD family hydrolase C-terminal non-catalytic domain-containing protein [Solirubrobacteraceae bacterium]